MSYLPFQLELGPLLLLGIMFFVASYVRGYSGFGLSALVVAGGSLITHPLNIVPVAMVLEILGSIGQAYSVWQDVNWKRVGLMLIGAAITMPFSIYFLSGLDINILRMIISAFILLICALLLLGFVLERPIGRRGTVGVGMISGVANSAAVGGLPVAVFLTASNTSPAFFRATMIVYLFAIDAVALPIMAQRGIFTWDTIYSAVLALPLVALGIYLGSKRFGSTAPQNFRQFVLILLTILAGIGFFRAFL